MAQTLESPPSTENGRKRLHITPFNETLLKTYISPAVLPSATNISFHSVQTFPDKGFGYVELPTMEAQKLKKKLNGAVLKGQKIRIEDAKPEKRKALQEEAGAVQEEEQEERPKKRSKKEGRKEGVLPGVELDAERSVKRGWTESNAERNKKRTKKDSKDKSKEDKKKKTREPSKYISEPELLFKTKLPPNVAAHQDKSRRIKKKSKTTNKSGEEAIVHEFENTKKYASFLKNDETASGQQATSGFVEGKGWINDDGDVVESEKITKKAKRLKDGMQRTQAQETPRKRKSAKDVDTTVTTKIKSATPRTPSVRFSNEIEEQSLSSSEPSSSEPSSSDTSSSDDDSSDDSSDDEETESNVSVTAAEHQATSAKEETTTSDETPAGEVHPLEALFKRPRPSGMSPIKPLEINTAFSFFGGGDEGTDEDESDTANVDSTRGAYANPPLTPYTRRDREQRGQRSAAPTPDTAARAGFFLDDENDEEENEEQEGQIYNGSVGQTEPQRTAVTLNGSHEAANAEAEQSEFAKWFWENRGENNRAWKRRRKEAMKLKRRRENRRLSRRIV